MNAMPSILMFFIAITRRIKSSIVKLIALIIKHDAEIRVMLIRTIAIAIAIMNGIPAFWNVFR